VTAAVAAGTPMALALPDTSNTSQAGRL
jgi:hypothetical protein